MLINHSKKQNLDMYLQLLPSQAHQNQSWPTGGMETLFGPLVPAVMVFVDKMFLCMFCIIQEKNIQSSLIVLEHRLVTYPFQIADTKKILKDCFFAARLFKNIYQLHTQSTLSNIHLCILKVHSATFTYTH